jgi:hypothetical protein
VSLVVKSKPTQFEIVDEDERLVKGWASVEVVDLQGDIVPISELKRAMYKFMDRGGMIMYGHSNKPVGKILQWDVEKYPGTDVYGISFVAKIFKDYPVDDAVWEAIKRGELRGFSIGAQAKEEKRLIKDANTGQLREVGVLHDLNLMEISIVKEPANPLALVEEVNFFAKSVSKEAVRKEILKRYGVAAPASLEGCALCERVKSILKELGHTDEEIADVDFALGVHAAVVEKAAELERVEKEAVEVRKLAERVKQEWEELAEEDDEFDRIMDEFGEEEEGSAEKQYNPWAICRAAQKKYGWSEEKFERCVKHVKEQNIKYGRPARGEEKALDEAEKKRKPWEYPKPKTQTRITEFKQETTGDVEPIDALGRRSKLETEPLIKGLEPSLVSALLAKRSELAQAEKAEDKRPPKAWWDYCMKTVKEGKPDYTDEQVRAICGSMWYHGWGLGSPKGRREHGGE